MQRYNTHKESEVLGMTLNYVWWWGYSTEDLGIVEYSFIAITPMSTLAEIDRTY